MESRPPISVVVPTRDRPDLLDGCLQAVRAALQAGDELIVVDSASTDERVRKVALANEAVYVRCERPGASRARNEGWRHATNEIVAFIDDDVHVDPEWAHAVARTFAAHPEAAFLTGRVGFPGPIRPRFAVAEIKVSEPFTIDRTTARDSGHGANFAAQRGALERVGGFDELLGAGGVFPAAEDKDLMDRLLGAGLVGRYEPSAYVIHLPWRSRREIVGLNWNYGLGSGVRMTKLIKTDRSRVPSQAKDLFWTWGLADFATSIRQGDKYLALVVAIRMTGMVLGIVWAIPTRVRNGHFQPVHPLLRRR